MVVVSSALALVLALHVCVSAPVMAVEPKPTPSTLTSFFELFADSNLIYDKAGRERYFHGTNVVYKEPPYHPSLSGFDSQLSFVAEDMSLMQSMGYSSIRLSVPWAAVEPSRGKYNTTYLSLMRSLVDQAGSYGISSLIDFHQDAWAAPFCGNGVASWAAPPPADPALGFPMPLAKPVPVDPRTGAPTRETCDQINGNDWSMFYLTYATSEAIGAVYDDVDGLRKAFAAYWGVVAKTFADSPHVIGYELMNEPFAGQVYKNPGLLVPGVADREKLQPLYDQVASAIREFDTSHLILFQGVVWEVVLPVGEKHGFTDVPGGAARWANKSVLAWHNSVLSHATPDDTYYAWKKSEMTRLRCGGWVTETGDAQLDLLDKWQLSWMQWDYKWFANRTYDVPGLFLLDPDDPYKPCVRRTSMDACLNRDAVPTWSRTHAKAVAGKTQAFSYNSSTKVAMLRFVPDARIAEPTVLFVSKAWVYTGGFDVDVQPEGALTWNNTEDEDHLLFQLARLDAGGVDVQITVAPSLP